MHHIYEFKKKVFIPSFAADSNAGSVRSFPLHGSVILKRHSAYGPHSVNIYANQISGVHYETMESYLVRIFDDG